MAEASTCIGTAYMLEALMKPFEAVLRPVGDLKIKTLVRYLHNLRPPGLRAL